MSVQTIPLPKLHIENKSSDSIEELKSYLTKTIKVVISDGRTIKGKFWCIDHKSNLVLAEAQEQRTVPFQPKSDLGTSPN